jgi:hypothetical protein
MADEDLAQAVSDMANSIQTATLLSDRLRADLAERSADVDALRAAIARAARALRQLQKR